MSQEIPKPVIVIAIIVAVVLAVFIGKSLMGGPPTASKEERAKFTPAWIDPATNKPRANGPPQTGGGAPGKPMGSPDRPTGSPGGH